MIQSTAVSASDEKLDFKRILPIFVIILVDLLGLTIIIPLLPLYATSFGADPLVIGLLGTSYPLMQFIGAPLLGGLSDRFGRKPILIISQIGTFIGFLVLGFANALWLIFLARIIDGLSGANIAVAQAALTDSTTEKTRAQGLGLLGAAFGLGFILGPIIAAVALVVSQNDYHVPAFIAAAFSLLSIVLTTFWFKETLPKERRGQHKEKVSTNVFSNIFRALRLPMVGTLLILMFFQQLIFGGFENLISLFTLNRLGINALGNAVIFVFVGVILVFVQGYFIGKWSRRFGERKLIYAGLALLAVGLTLTSLTPSQPAPWYSRSELVQELTQNESILSSGQGGAVSDLSIDIPEDGNNGWLGLIWIMVAMIPASIGGGILSPSINSLLTRRVGEHDVGGTLGVSAALVSAANAITPLLGGSIFKWLGSTAPFLIGGVVLGILCFIAFRKVVPDPQEKQILNQAG
ncbi:MAG: MFS transporter [Anaerolineae bacterium]|nr:MFS transporter [Anaerolineae bacterium]